MRFIFYIKKIQLVCIAFNFYYVQGKGLSLDKIICTPINWTQLKKDNSSLQHITHYNGICIYYGNQLYRSTVA